MRRFLALTIVALTTVLAVPRAARACGDTHAFEAPTRDQQARAVVEAHFAALAGGDATAVSRLWSRTAKVTTVAADGTRTTRPLKKALRKWLAHRDGLRWEIGAIDVRDDGRVVVKLKVTWNGAEYTDLLTLRGADDELVIVAKLSRPVVASSGGYG
jgi:hypothetical protein